MYLDSNVKKIFFTSDTHFGHKNIIKYCDRPFDNVSTMTDGLIANWNSVVGTDDTVFHLGDFAFLPDPTDIIHSLNGHIFVVPGNHDSDSLDKAFKNINYRDGRHGKFDIMPQLAEVKIKVADENILFVLCHYAMRVWNKSHRGAIHLYGHSHGTLPEDPNSLSMDVGVDCNNYTPISLDDVLVRMYKKKFKSVDHHGEAH